MSERYCHNRSFQLGSWTIDPDESTIQGHGQFTRIDHKAMHVLGFLADHPERTVTREAIFDHVWPGTAVTDDVLTVAISTLRRALGDDAKNPFFIRTLPKRGYRLLVSPSANGKPQSSNTNSQPDHRRIYLHQLELLTQAATLSTRVDLDAEAHQQNLRIVEKVKQILDSQSTPSLWSRSLENVAAMEQSLYLRQDAPGFDPADPDATFRHPSVIKGSNLRDRAMAESLLWILGSDPKAKIVVWAANTHVAYRHLGESIAIDGEIVLRRPAGQYLRETLDIDVFTVLTVTYEGQWAAPSIEREGEWLWTSGEYPPAPEGSLAFQLDEQGLEHALVDIREDPNQYTDRHSLFGSDPVDFSTFCDAILFIRTMQPSVKISKDSSIPKI